MTDPAIGMLRRRVDLLRPVETPDGAGGTLTDHEPAGSAWAEVRALSLAEAERAGRLSGLVTHRVRLRYTETIAGGWRITDGPRTLHVLATTDRDGRRRFTECLCEEETP